MKRALILLIAGTILSGVAAAYAATATAQPEAIAQR
jgi:hypothetical protein